MVRSELAAGLPGSPTGAPVKFHDLPLPSLRLAWLSPFFIPLAPLLAPSQLQLFFVRGSSKRDDTLNWEATTPNYGFALFAPSRFQPQMAALPPPGAPLYGGDLSMPVRKLRRDIIVAGPKKGTGIHLEGTKISRVTSDRKSEAIAALRTVLSNISKSGLEKDVREALKAKDPVLGTSRTRSRNPSFPPTS